MADQDCYHGKQKSIPGGNIQTPRTENTDLEWALAESDRRIKLFETNVCRNLKDYNAHHEPKLPQIFIVISGQAPMSHHWILGRTTGIFLISADHAADFVPYAIKVSDACVAEMQRI